MENCIFCKIGKKTAPASIVFENESVIAFKSIEPVSEIHVLVVPKTHFDSFMDISDEAIVALKNAVQRIITELNVESAYRLVINGGTYPSVHHIHWHILAGKAKDGDPLSRT